jgi:hypothetical protein
MAGHDNSESDKSYSDDVEFKVKDKEILLGLSNGGVRFSWSWRGHLCAYFFHGKKVPSCSLRELLQHVNGNSQRGEGISRPEHSALAKYILNNDAMARDCELGGVGDCGENEAVKAHRD